MVAVTAQIQNRFFDRQRVIEAIGRENVRKLGRMGAFVRQRARTQILRRGGMVKVSTGKSGRDNKGRFLKQSVKRRASAAPGRPPLVHSRDNYANLRNIQFGLSLDENSVVIGPLMVPSMRPKGSTARTIPELLTKGGYQTLDQYSLDGENWEMGSSPFAPFRRTIRARYDEHPFMGPALDAEVAAGTVGTVWKSSAF